MFDSFDGDRDGRIDTAELGLALANYGYARLSNDPVFSH
jgi:Ca2+-binding EF-hand superfamily protein